jgi:acyl dehydratase
MRYSDLYFEDFTPGRRFETDARTIGADDIIAFGTSYAPLPYHTDPEAARDSMFGGLVAAGFQTAAISFALFIEAGVFSACAMGSPGLDRLRWLRPVRAGDTLRVVVEIIEASPAQGPKGRNLIKSRYQTVNQDGEAVLEMLMLNYVRARGG